MDRAAILFVGFRSWCVEKKNVREKAFLHRAEEPAATPLTLSTPLTARTFSPTTDAIPRRTGLNAPASARSNRARARRRAMVVETVAAREEAVGDARERARVVLARARVDRRLGGALDARDLVDQGRVVGRRAQRTARAAR